MYPREVVDEALRLKQQGWTDRAVAEQCEVSIWTVRHWRTGRRRRAGRKAASRHSPCPRCEQKEIDAFAYSYLLGLYLGDGHISRAPRSHRLSIYCSTCWPGIMEEGEAVMRRVIPASVYRQQRSEGCTALIATAKHWPCLFPQHGAGMKHTRKIELEPWQQTMVDAHPDRLIRGLIHSDGCRSINRIRKKSPDGDKFYEYPRYFFYNVSTDIMRLCGETLDRLGIAWKMNNWNSLSIARKDAVAEMDRIVGPKY